MLDLEASRWNVTGAAQHLRLVAAAVALIVLALAGNAPARTPRATTQAPTLSVLTFGPGDHPFTKFGHDALWVHDPGAPTARRDLVFNYGTFRFDSPWLILDFLKGRLGYWLSASSLRSTLAGYRAANRALSAQQLDIPPDKAREIVEFLYENAKPENKYYRYDYYLDNCATRIRDLLDNHLDHSLKRASEAPAGLNYRQHTRRLTQASPALFFGIDLMMGPMVDRKIELWDAMFLPSQLELVLKQATTRTGKPLLRSTRSLLKAARSPEPNAPPSSLPWLALGTGLGGLLWALARLHSCRWARVAFAATATLVSLAVGLLGAGLWVLCTLTDHEVTFWNQNVILCPIWALALPWFWFDWARETPRRLSLSFRVVSVVAGLCWLLLAAQPFLEQNSEPALGVFLPLWTALALAVWGRNIRAPQPDMPQ